MTVTTANPTPQHKCRECNHRVSEHAQACPGCGAPFPTKAQWDGWGYEYKSKANIFGIPLLHISFKYRRKHGIPVPVVARGVISIGQFGIGLINISQFGIGVFSLAQFTIARYAIAQFAIARYALCQMGLVHEGLGQQLVLLKDLFGM